MKTSFSKITMIVCLVCTPVSVSAQPDVVMKRGKVLVDGKQYCYYQEGQGRTSAQYLHVMDRSADVSPDFHNWYIFSLDSQLVITIEARSIAHSKKAYLEHYYSIKFLPTGDVINSRFHPLRVESFVKDLVKFGVLKNGAYQHEAAAKVVQRWKVKPESIRDEYLAGGVTEPYVTVGKRAVQDSLVQDIKVEGGWIYKGDSIIATYREGPAYNPNEFMPTGRKTYYVRNNNGEDVLVVVAPNQRSQVFVMLLPEKEQVQFITPDKSEERLIRVATGLLLIRHKL